MSAYKENKWGKDIDGYSYKGKKASLKALEGFKNLMKKGVIEEINGMEFKVLIQERSELD